MSVYFEYIAGQTSADSAYLAILTHTMYIFMLLLSFVLVFVQSSLTCLLLVWSSTKPLIYERVRKYVWYPFSLRWIGFCEWNLSNGEFVVNVFYRIEKFIARSNKYNIHGLATVFFDLNNKRFHLLPNPLRKLLNLIYWIVIIEFSTLLYKFDEEAFLNSKKISWKFCFSKMSPTCQYVPRTSIDNLTIRRK